MSPSRLRRLALALSVTTIALTACVGGQVSGRATSADGSAGPTTPASSAETPTSSAEPEPTPTPDAADGTDLAACADGECEVRVAAPAEVPVPDSTTVVDFRVESIGADEVTFTGRNTGNRSGGSCTGRCRVSSTNGVFTMTLGVGGAGRQNGLAVTVVAVAGDHAVVRLRTV